MREVGEVLAGLDAPERDLLLSAFVRILAQSGWNDWGQVERADGTGRGPHVLFDTGWCEVTEDELGAVERTYKRLYP